MSEAENAIDDMGLKGRVAIVTGGGARGFEIGNGRAAAILLARAGAHVVVVDRAADASQRTVQMIEREGGSAVAFAADVTDESDCEALRSMVTRELGPPQVLVNNVGIGAAGTVVQTDPAVWERVMNTNVTSMYLTSRTLIPAMAEAGGGAIVNISAADGLEPTLMFPIGGSMRASLSALTKLLARRLGGDRIRVNSVLPWVVLDPTSEWRSEEIPLSRAATHAEIAHAVSFLCSPAGSYLTGVNLPVDGGWSRGL